MAIVSLNMGNLNMEVNNMMNRFSIREKEKAILQEDWTRKETSRRGISIMWKSRRRLQDVNEELKGSTTQLKSHDEKL
jgi:hypothetical protein